MSQTALTTQTLKNNNRATSAGDLKITFAAIDTVNGNSFTATGREVLIFQNTDTVGHTVTISSLPDERGRLDTGLTNYNIPAGEFHAVDFQHITGWALPLGGAVTLSCASALVKVAVLQKN